MEHLPNFLFGLLAMVGFLFLVIQLMEWLRRQDLRDDEIARLKLEVECLRSGEPCIRPPRGNP